jgi:hypothetical protein
MGITAEDEQIFEIRSQRIYEFIELVEDLSPSRSL